MSRPSWKVPSTPRSYAHHSDRTEAEARIARDRGGVAHRRVDHDPMMAEVVDQVLRQRPDGIGGNATPVVRREHGDVDAGVDVLRVELLSVLDEAHRLGVAVDGQVDAVLHVRLVGDGDAVEHVLVRMWRPPLDDPG